MAGIITFSLALGGGAYGYLNGWFCQWGVGSCEIELPDPPTVDDLCDPNNEAFDLEACVFEDEEIDQSTPDSVVTDVPGETGSYWDLSIRQSNRTATFGEVECDEQAPNLHACIDVLYSTPRKLEFRNGEHYFGRDFDYDHTTFGHASISVPLPCSDLESEECDPIWNFVEHDGQTPLDVADIDRTVPLSNVERREKVGVALHNIESDRLLSDAERAELFANKVREAVKRSDGRIFLYVHGFNQTFDVAVQTAALMTVDLNFDPKKPLALKRSDQISYPLGYPLVFSWPNREAVQSYMFDKGQFANEEMSDAEFMAFVRANKVFLRANIPSIAVLASITTLAEWMRAGIPASVNVNTSGPELAVLFSDLMTVTNDKGVPIVKEVNIFLHSMGNRLLLTSFEQMAQSYVSNKNQAELRFVHAAADLSHREFTSIYERSLATKNVDYLEGSFNPAISVYASEDDGALANSRFFSSFNTGCRVGYIVDDICLPISQSMTAEGIDLEVIDATGFVLAGTSREGVLAQVVQGREVVDDDRGHGYGQNAAFFLSDLGCAFDGIRASSGKRALKEFTEPVSITRKGFYRPYLGDNYDSRCARFEFLSSEDDECAPFLEKVTIIDGFELLGSEVPVPAFESIELLRECLQTNEHLLVSIVGYADTSGELDLNNTLSDRRARSVAFLLRESNSNLDIEVAGLGEVRGQANLANNKSDNVRSSLNRRVEISVITESEQLDH
ncbi:MAG: alpha/beta hydrolase [Pseudomonadota bacterium]